MTYGNVSAVSSTYVPAGTTGRAAAHGGGAQGMPATSLPQTHSLVQNNPPPEGALSGLGTVLSSPKVVDVVQALGTAACVGVALKHPVYGLGAAAVFNGVTEPLQKLWEAHREGHGYSLEQAAKDAFRGAATGTVTAAIGKGITHAADRIARNIFQAGKPIISDSASKVVYNVGGQMTTAATMLLSQGSGASPRFSGNVSNTVMGQQSQRAPYVVG